MNKGRLGEKYLLTGENASFKHVFDISAAITGTKKPWFNIPMWAIDVYGWLSVIFARITGKLPLISPPVSSMLPGQTSTTLTLWYYLHYWYHSSTIATITSRNRISNPNSGSGNNFRIMLTMQSGWILSYKSHWPGCVLCSTLLLGAPPHSTPLAFLLCLICHISLPSFFSSLNYTFLLTILLCAIWSRLCKFWDINGHILVRRLKWSWVINPGA